MKAKPKSVKLKTALASIGGQGGLARVSSALKTLFDHQYSIRPGAMSERELKERDVHVDVRDIWLAWSEASSAARYAPGDPTAEELAKLRLLAEAVVAGIAAHPGSRAPVSSTKKRGKLSGGSASLEPLPETALARLDAHRKRDTLPYVLVFGRAQQRTMKDDLLNRAVSVPRIDFGKHCVCCDEETSMTRPLRGDAYGDYYGGHLYEAPVCGECRRHAARGEVGDHMTAYIAVLAFLGLIASLAFWNVAMLMFVGVVISILCARALLDRILRRRHQRNGHHAAMAFHIGAGYVTVETYNPRLARDLMDRYRDILRPPSTKLPKPKAF